jgi:hypothetical protein
MLGGVLSFFILPSPYRYISGGLLVIAGTMVMTMRNQRRPNGGNRKTNAGRAKQLSLRGLSKRNCLKRRQGLI